MAATLLPLTRADVQAAPLPDVSRDLRRFESKAGGATAWANNIEGGFSFEIAPGKVLFGSGPGNQVGVRMTAIGRDDRGFYYQPGHLQLEGNTATAGENGDLLREEWVNLPEGLKHTFILSSRPPGMGRLQCLVDSEGADALDVGGENVRFLKNGREILACKALKVWDAKGRSLPACFISRRGGFAIEVDDRDAVYPVTVDPLFTSSVLLTMEGAAVTLAMDEDVLLVGVPGWNLKPGSNLASTLAGAGSALGGVTALDGRDAVGVAADLYAAMLKECLTNLGWVDNTIYGAGAVFSYQKVRGHWEFRDIIQRWKQAVTYTGWDYPIYSEEGANFGASVAVAGGSAMIGSPGFKFTQYINTYIFGAKRWSGPHDVGAVEFYSKPFPRNEAGSFQRIARFQEITQDGTSRDFWTAGTNSDGLLTYRRVGEKVAMTPSYAVTASGKGIDIDYFGTLQNFTAGTNYQLKEPAYGPCKLHYFRYGAEGRWVKDPVTFTPTDTGAPIEGLGIIGNDAARDVVFLTSGWGDSGWSLRLKPDPWVNQASGIIPVEQFSSGGMSCALAVSERRAVVGVPGSNQIRVFDFKADRTWTSYTLSAPAGISSMGRSVTVLGDFILATAGANGTQLIGWRRAADGTWDHDTPEAADGDHPTLALAMNTDGEAALTSADGGNSRLNLRQVSRRFEGTVMLNGQPAAGVPVALTAYADIPCAGESSWGMQKFDVDGDLGYVYHLQLLPGRSPSLPAKLSAILVPPLQPYDSNLNGKIDRGEYNPPDFGGMGSPDGIDLEFEGLLGSMSPISLGTRGEWQFHFYGDNIPTEGTRLRSWAVLPGSLTSPNPLVHDWAVEKAVLTDSQGRFRFDGLDGGYYQVEALDSYKGSTGSLLFRSVIQRNVVLNVTGNLKARGKIAAINPPNIGLPTYSTPIPGVKVRVTQGGEIRETVSRADGSYEVDGLLPGPLSVTTVDNPYSFEAAVWSGSIPVNGYAEANFRALGNGSITFDVLRALGGVLANTEVTVSGPFGYSRKFMSDAQGRVFISNLLPGTYSIIGTGQGLDWQREAVRVTIPTGGSMASYDVTADPIRSVGGGVSARVTEAGEDRAGFKFTMRKILSETDRSGWMVFTSTQEATSFDGKKEVVHEYPMAGDGVITGGKLVVPYDDFGWMNLDHRRSPRLVVVEHPDGYQIPVGPLPSEPADGITRIYSDPYTYRLVMQEIDLSAFAGMPCKGTWKVRRFYDQPLRDRSFPSSYIRFSLKERTYGQANEGWTDSSGRCGFYDLPSGSYELKLHPYQPWSQPAEASRWPWQVQTVPIATNQLKELGYTPRRNNTFTGKIACGPTRLPSTVVRLRDTSGASLECVSDTAGNFTFPLVPSGDYKIESGDSVFSCPSQATQRITRDMENQRLSVTAVAGISGSLMDSTGKPLAGERFRLTPEWKRFEMPAVTGVRTTYNRTIRFPLTFGATRARIASLRAYYHFAGPIEYLRMAGIEAGDGYQRRFYQMPSIPMFTQNIEGYYSDVPAGSEWQYSFDDWGTRWQHSFDALSELRGKSLSGTWNFFARHGSGSLQTLNPADINLWVDSWRLPADNATREVTTDSAGRFTFNGLGPSFFRVEHVPGARYFCSTPSQPVDASVSTPEFTFHALQQRATGIITQNGLPVSGFAVLLSGDSGAIYRATTGVDGSFSLEIPSRERIRIHAADETRWFGRDDVYVAAENDGSTPLQLTLIPRETPNFAVTAASGLKGPALFQKSWFQCTGPVSGTIEFDTPEGTPLRAGAHSFSYVFTPSAGSDRFRPVAGTTSISLGETQMYPVFGGDSALWQTRFPFASANQGALRAVSLGDEYGIGLLTGGSIFSWNFSGSPSAANLPSSLGVVRCVAAGPSHAVAVLADGSVRCWGDDDGSGKLGASGAGIEVAAGLHYTAVLRPDRSLEIFGSLSGSHAGPFRSIAGGRSSLVATRMNGTVLVLGDAVDRVVRDAPSGLFGVVAAAVGRDHALVQFADGSVRAWGADNENQVTGVPFGLSDGSTPVAAIAAAGNGSVAIGRDGHLHVWGAAPPLPDPAPADCLAASSNSELLLVLTGSRRSLGSDLDDDGLIDDIDPDIDNDGVANVHDALPYNPAESGDHDGDGIGDNADSDDDNDGCTDGIERRLGFDPLSNQSKPGPSMVIGRGNNSVADLPSDIVDFDSSAYISVFLRANGTVVVRCWDDWTRERVKLLESESNLVQVAAGNQFVMGLRSDGTPVIYGSGESYNTYFFHNDAWRTSYSQPPGVPTHVIDISAFGDVAAWLKEDGTAGSLEYRPSWYQHWIPIHQAFGSAGTSLAAVYPGSETSAFIRKDGTAFLANAAGVIELPTAIPALYQMALGTNLFSGIDAQGNTYRWDGQGRIAPAPTLPALKSISHKGYGLVGLTADGKVRFIPERTWDSQSATWGVETQTTPEGFPDPKLTGFRKVQVHSNWSYAGLREFRYPVVIASSNPQMGAVMPQEISDSVPGALISVEARPVSGHVFTGWTGSFAGMPVSFSWPTNGPIEATAEFEKDMRDPDSDGLTTYDEVVLYHSNPDLKDTDGDGLADGDEVAVGADPRMVDTDGDGKNDGEDALPIDHRFFTPRPVSQPGYLVAWGLNSFGQTSMGNLGDLRFTQVVAKGYNTLALTSDGEVLAWGSNDSGQLNIPDSAKSGIARIALDRSGNDCYALTKEGEVLCWGGASDLNPELSHGVVDIAAGLALKADGSLHEMKLWQTPIPQEARRHVIEIASDGFHYMALLTGGKVVSWGLDFDGLTHVPTEASSGVTSIGTSGDTAYAVTSTGRIISWGYPEYPPASIASGVAKVFPGGGFAQRNDGSLVSWGSNYFGQATIPAGISENVIGASRSWFHSAIIVGPRTITGTLLDDAGHPLEGAHFRANSGNREVIVTTGEDGSFSFTVDGANSISLTLEHGTQRGTANGWSISAGSGNLSNLALHAVPKLSQRPDSTPPAQVGWGSVFRLPSRSNANQLLGITVDGDGVLQPDGSVLAGPLGGTIFVSLSAPATNDYLAYQEVIEIAVGKRTQSLEYSPPARAWIGQALATAAHASSGLPIALRVVSGPARIDDGGITFTGIGPVVIEATQSGDAFYEPVSKTVTIIGELLPTTLAIAGNNLVFDGKSKPVTVTSDPPGVPVVVTYDGHADAPYLPGSYAVHAVVNSPLHSGEVRGTLTIILGGFKPVFSEADDGIIRRTYHGAEQADPALAVEPDGLTKHYSYRGTTAAGAAYGPTGQAPTDAGTYTVEVVAGNGSVAGSASASLVVAPGRHKIALKPGFSSIVVGQSMDLSQALSGMGSLPFRVEVLSGDASLERALIAWGAQGEVGQTGLGGPATRQLDLPSIPALEVADIALGDGYGLLLKTDGSIVEWGGHFNYEIPAEASSGIAAIAAGPETRAAVTSSGRLIHWGGAWMTEGGMKINDWGYPEYVWPEDVTTPPEFLQGNVSSVVLASNFGAALLKDGSVAQWGVVPAVNPFANPWDETDWRNQFIVPKPEELPPVSALSASRDHILALDINGCVHAWGYNYFDGCSVPVEAQSGVVAVYAGLTKSYAVKADGSHISWGYGWTEWDEASQGAIDFQADPPGLSAKSFGIGLKSVVALTPDDHVLTWGASPMNAAATPLSLSQGRTRWVRMGEDFAVAMHDTPTLAASSAGIIRIRVSLPADANHLATEQELEIQAGVAEIVPVTVDIVGAGGSVSGTGNLTVGSTTVLRAIPQPGYVPLGWVIDGQSFSPNPALEVTVHSGLTAAIRFGRADDDEDGDGQSNLLEYALGGSPLTSSASPFQITSDGGNFEIRFPRIADPSLHYELLSADSPVGPWQGGIWSSTGASNTTGQIKIQIPRPATPSRVYRLRVDAP